MYLNAKKRMNKGVWNRAFRSWVWRNDNQGIDGIGQKKWS